MRIYTVHAPSADGTLARPATDRFVFVRDGFSFWAFLFGPVWLLYRRLWLAVLGYVVLTVVLEVALTLLHAGSGTRAAVMAVIAVLMGLEANSLWRWTLARRKWRQLDVVAANNEQAAERRFFDRWAAGRDGDIDPVSVDRGAPPPTRSVPGQPFSQPPPLHSDIIGLFPQSGAPS